MSQVNLLPPEILQRQRYRRLSMLVALVGCVLLVLILAFYLLQVGALGSVRSDIEAQEATNADIQAQIDGLQEFADLRSEAEQKEALLTQVYAGEVSFSGILMDLSSVIPSDSYLQDMSVQITVAAPGTEGVDTGTGAEVDPSAIPTGLVGQLTATGRAASYDAMPTFLIRMESVEGWLNPWVSTASQEEDEIWAFSIGADLSSEVVTPRGRGEIGGAG